MLMDEFAELKCSYVLFGYHNSYISESIVFGNDTALLLF